MPPPNTLDACYERLPLEGIERYSYVATLGEGAYGVVLKCRSNVTGALLAVKGYKSVHEDRATLAVAMREARMLGSLRHANITRLIECISSKSGRIYLVLEYVGPNLLNLLRHVHPTGLPPGCTKAIAWQLAQAVSYMHSKKILHRDIKPANVLLDPASGAAKLCDLGLARPFWGGPREAHPCTTYCVTRWYRPPEVLVGDDYGPAVDVWSLGCTLAELATGRVLFPGKSPADQLWRILCAVGPMPQGMAARLAFHPNAALQFLAYVVPPPPQPVSLRSLLPDVEPRLFELVEACLRLDPATRPTARELLDMPYFWDVGRCSAVLPAVAQALAVLAESEAAAAAVAASPEAMEVEGPRSGPLPRKHRGWGVACTGAGEDEFLSVPMPDDDAMLPGLGTAAAATVGAGSISPVACASAGGVAAAARPLGCALAEWTVPDSQPASLSSASRTDSFERPALIPVTRTLPDISVVEAPSTEHLAARVDPAIAGGASQAFASAKPQQQPPACGRSGVMLSRASASAPGLRPASAAVSATRAAALQAGSCASISEPDMLPFASSSNHASTTSACGGAAGDGDGSSGCGDGPPASFSLATAPALTQTAPFAKVGHHAPNPKAAASISMPRARPKALSISLPSSTIAAAPQPQLRMLQAPAKAAPSPSPPVGASRRASAASAAAVAAHAQAILTIAAPPKLPRIHVVHAPTPVGSSCAAPSTAGRISSTSHMLSPGETPTAGGGRHSQAGCPTSPGLASIGEGIPLSPAGSSRPSSGPLAWLRRGFSRSISSVREGSDGEAAAPKPPACPSKAPHVIKRQASLARFITSKIARRLGKYHT